MKSLKKLQRGAGLMEVLVAMTISLIVTASMIALMSNTLGTTARIIKMTKLSDDLRLAMQMMSRDVRRSSYNANSMYCYANDDCGSDGIMTLAGDINIDASGNCFTFQTDRDHDGDSTENSAGGFRRVATGGVGVLEMWTGGPSPDCDADAGAADWVQITNPDSMDVTTFDLNDLSYTREVFNNGAGTIIEQKIRRIQMNLGGQLVTDNRIQRNLVDVIAVRNDLLL